MYHPQHKFIIPTNKSISSPHSQVQKHNRLLIACSSGAEEVVGEMGCHIVKRNLQIKVENESVERYELIVTIYKLTLAPNPCAAKFGDGV
jgi:hypothetical protein